MIKYNAETKIVTLSILGLIKMSESLHIIGEMVHLGRDYDCRLFILNGDEVIIQDNFIEVYTLFDNLELYLQKRSDRLAIVFKRQKNLFNFIDSVAINHGFTLKTFNDHDKACRWLNFKTTIHNS
jgi:hypothetical protein